MDKLNIALSVVSEELQQLREENKMLKNCIKSTKEDIDKRHKLYVNLVSLARSDPSCSKYQGRIDQIKSKIGEKVYKQELAKLMDKDEHDWVHGFNSGMLAATRLYSVLLQYIPDVFDNGPGDEYEFPVADMWEQAKEEFPMLDT